MSWRPKVYEIRRLDSISSKPRLCLQSYTNSKAGTQVKLPNSSYDSYLDKMAASQGTNLSTTLSFLQVPVDQSIVNLKGLLNVDSLTLLENLNVFCCKKCE